MAIKNDTEAWDNFVAAPVDVFVAIHLWNITNMHEFPKMNPVPTVEEIGPCVYL